MKKILIVLPVLALLLSAAPVFADTYTRTPSDYYPTPVNSPVVATYEDDGTAILALCPTVNYFDIQFQDDVGNWIHPTGDPYFPVNSSTTRNFTFDLPAGTNINQVSILADPSSGPFDGNTATCNIGKEGNTPSFSISANQDILSSALSTLNLQTLAKVCRMGYEYNGSSTVATTTEVCNDPVKSFALIGGLIIGFFLVVFGIIRIFK